MVPPTNSKKTRNKISFVFIVRLVDEFRSAVVVVGQSVPSLLFIIFQAIKSYEKPKTTFLRDQNFLGLILTNNAHYHNIIIRRI